MKEALKNIQIAAEKKIADAVISKELEELRVTYLGKKGELTSILKEMRSLSSEERPIIGQIANEVRDSIEKMLKEKGAVIHEKELAEKLKKEKIDVTMPSRFIKKGHLHPLTKTLNEFYAKGYIRFLGVSNWTGKRIDEANEYAEKKNLMPLSISQICFSLAKTTPDLMKDDTIVCMNDSEYKWYKENNFPVMAFSSQAKGLYPKLLSGKTLSGKCLERYGTEENIKKAEKVAKIAEEKGISPAAVSILYVSSNPINSIAVFSPSSVEQLRDTMSAMKCEFTNEEIKYLDTE